MAIIKRFTYQDIDAIRVGRLKHAINTSFVLYRVGDTLIDTGPTNQWRFVRRFVAEKRLRQILITHHHEDHAGNAASLIKQTGLQPMASEKCLAYMAQGYTIPWLQHLIWGAAKTAQLAPLEPDLYLQDGSTIVPVPAPGHADDLICFFLPERGWLFSADMFIARNMKYLRYDEHLPTLLASLRKLLTLDFTTLLCPHRGVVEDGKVALQDKFDNLSELVANAHALSRQGLEATEISRRLLGPEDLTSRLSHYQFCKRNLIQGCLQVKLSELETTS